MFVCRQRSRLWLFSLPSGKLHLRTRTSERRIILRRREMRIFSLALLGAGDYRPGRVQLLVLCSHLSLSLSLPSSHRGKLPSPSHLLALGVFDVLVAGIALDSAELCGDREEREERKTREIVMPRTFSWIRARSRKKSVRALA